MPEPTADPRARKLAETRLRIAHEPYGTTASFGRLRPDEQHLLIEEAATWLRAAVEAGIAPPAAEQPTDETCGKCKKPFGPDDRRVRRGDQPETAYCRACVDFCADTEIADHRCVICA
ncbi:hypothetical protein [Streptomyces sp. NPDC047042]|uniref:hypothetical protein n=1 Tax=Streptomyces sp. NPDC047042 TaxID=3154807 RepID=UPI0033FACACD